MAGSDRGHPEDRAQEIFEEISELPPEARKRRLEEICDDEAVRLEVERMLQAYGRLQEMMDVMEEADPSATSESGGSGEGDRIDRFELLERAGEGGMGVVYRARDTQLDRVVALKLLPDRFGDDRTARQRFLREAQTASQLDHPNVAPLHEYGETDDGRTYLVMPFYEGDTLEDRLSTGPLDLDGAIDVATQLCEGLGAAHDEGIVHRDVKPGNVLLPDGQPVKLVDFGLAKWTNETAITRTDSVLGSVAYMSPEQLQGQPLDERTDVWSLGVVLYEMLTFERPFEGRYPEALAYEIINGEHEPPSDRREEVPDEVDTLIARCLAKDPSDRYETIRELGDRLRALTSTASNNEPPEGPTERSGSNVTLSSSVTETTAGAFVAALIVAGLAFGLWSGSGGSAPSEKDASPPGSSVHRYAVMVGDSVVLDQSERILLRDLSVTTTSLLTEMKPHLPGNAEILPAGQLKEANSLETAEDRLGISHVISLHLLGHPPNRRLHLDLIDARTLRQTASTTLELDSAGVRGQRAGFVSKLSQLLDVNLPRSSSIRLSRTREATPQARAFYRDGRKELNEAAEAIGEIEDLNTSIRYFRLAIETDSSFVSPYVGLAEAYWRKFKRTGDTVAAKRARRYEQELGELKGTPDAEVYVRRGILNALRGQYQRALTDFDFALSLDSTNFEALLGLARTHGRLGRDHEAEDLFQRAISRRPNDWRPHNDFGKYLLTRNELKRAAGQFKAVIRLDSTSGTGYVNLGVTRSRQNRDEEALRLFHRALESPNLSRKEKYLALVNIGAIHYYEQNYDEAADMYERALLVDSSETEVWGGLMYTYKHQNRERMAKWAAAGAAERLESRLKMRSSDPELLTNMAAYLQVAGRGEEARQYLRKARKARPNTADTWFEIGYVYEQLGERTRAINFVSEAVGRGFPLQEVKERPSLTDLVEDPRFQRALKEQSSENREPITVTS